MKAGLLTRSPETNAFPVAFLRHVAGVSTFPRRQSRQPVARLFAPEGLHTAAGLSGIPTRFPVGHHRVNLHALAKVLQTSEITKKAKAFLLLGDFRVQPYLIQRYCKRVKSPKKQKPFCFWGISECSLTLFKGTANEHSAGALEVVLERLVLPDRGGNGPFWFFSSPQKKKEDVLLGSFYEFTRSGTGMFYVLER